MVRLQVQDVVGLGRCCLAGAFPDHSHGSFDGSFGSLVAVGVVGSGEPRNSCTSALVYTVALSVANSTLICIILVTSSLTVFDHLEGKVWRW